MTHPPLRPTRLFVAEPLDDAGHAITIAQGMAGTAIVAEHGHQWPVTVLVRPGVSDLAIGNALVAIARELLGADAVAQIEVTSVPRLQVVASEGSPAA